MTTKEKKRREPKTQSVLTWTHGESPYTYRRSLGVAGRPRRTFHCRVDVACSSAPPSRLVSRRSSRRPVGPRLRTSPRPSGAPCLQPTLTRPSDAFHRPRPRPCLGQRRLPEPPKTKDGGCPERPSPLSYPVKQTPGGEPPRWGEITGCERNYCV